MVCPLRKLSGSDPILAPTRYALAVTIYVLIFSGLVFSSCESTLSVTANTKEKKIPAEEPTNSQEKITVKVSNVSSDTANGSYKDGGMIDVTITFSDVVNVSGSPTLLLNTNADSSTAIPYKSGSGSKVLIFSYTVAAGDRSVKLDYASDSALRLNGGAITDANGNAAEIALPSPGSSGSLSSNKTIIIDNDLPTISNLESLTVAPGQTSSPISFHIHDATSPMTCSSATLTMSSSNAALVSDSNVTWSGTYPNCSASIEANSGSQGTTMITFTVRDPAGSSATMDFPLFVSNALVYGQMNPHTDSSYYSPLVTFGSVLIGGRMYSGGKAKILVWNSMPDQDNQAPDFVIGSFSTKSSYLTQYASELGFSSGGWIRVASDGTNLVAADNGNSRVLIWHKAPVNPRTPPDVVLGQADFTGTSSNRGGSATASTLSGPSGVVMLNGKLVICDTGNNRVLVWNSIPTASGTAADLVLGQPDFTTTSAATTSLKLSAPNGIATNGTALAVMDASNYRVMIWNQMPSSSGQSADVVVGQANFTSATTATTLSSLTSYPRGAIAFYGNKLLVGDYARILVWNSVPTTNGMSADFVIGQANGTTMTYDQASSWSFNWIFGLSVIDGKVIVGDSSPFYAVKTAIWNSLPATYNTNFAVQLTEVLPAVNSWQRPRKQFTDGTRLFAIPYSGSAVYIWNAIPSSTATAPDLVLGQIDFTSTGHNYGGVSASSLSNPTAVIVVGSKLIVADSGNSRVLIWNSMPTANNQAADVVIGQANFTSNLQDRGGARAANTLMLPKGLATDGTKLLIGDSGWRILIYNAVPTTNGTNANVVVGQANFTATAVSVSQSSFSDAEFISVAGTKLIVPDQWNHRVLIWNTIPTTNGASANLILGQANFTSGTANSGGISATSLNRPGSVAYDGTRMFINDCYNNRVLYWNSVPTSSGQAADGVMFQPNFTSNSANAFGYGYSPFDVNMPASILIANSRIWVTESVRTLVRDLP